MFTNTTKVLIGWREWISLPQLGIPRIKAKTDTGARTSALDVSDLRLDQENEGNHVSFTVTYGTKKNPKQKRCRARVLDYRKVTNSGGQGEQRAVIRTSVRIGDIDKPVEITLTERKDMKFRMLLGRTTLGSDFLVDSSRSYVTRTK